MNPLRILLVDDSAEFLESAARLLMLHRELWIVGRAASGSAALEQVAELNPDLVLMDLAMPGMNGLELTSLIAERMPGLPVILLTAHCSELMIRSASSHGACGCLSKPFDVDEISQLIERSRAAASPRPS